MKITFEITKKKVVLLAFIISILSFSIIYAYNSGKKAIEFGHTGEEIDVKINGKTKNLNQAIAELSKKPSLEIKEYDLNCGQKTETKQLNHQFCALAKNYDANTGKAGCGVNQCALSNTAPNTWQFTCSSYQCPIDCKAVCFNFK